MSFPPLFQEDSHTILFWAWVPPLHGYHYLWSFWAENRSSQGPQGNSSARLWLGNLVENERVRVAGRGAHPPDRLQMCNGPHLWGICGRRWALISEALKQRWGSWSWAWGQWGEDLCGEHLWAGWSIHAQQTQEALAREKNQDGGIATTREKGPGRFHLFQVVAESPGFCVNLGRRGSSKYNILNSW